MHSLSRRAVLAAIGLTLVLHTIEEYATFPEFLSSPDGGLPEWLHPNRFLHNSHELRIALMIATVLPLAVIAWAILRPRKGWLISALLLESILLVNAAWHMLAAIVRHGYAPGVVTAVLVNLPFGVYVLRRAVKEEWIGAGTAALLIGSALLLHVVALGSLLVG